MPLKFLRVITILLVALVTGLAFAHVLELPAKLRYDATLYLTIQKSLYVHWGPPQIGGFLEPLAILVTALHTYMLRSTKLGFWLSGGALFALLLAFPLVFFWLVAPSNAVFMSATAQTLPPEWAELRSAWEMGHAIRFALQFVALVLLVSSVAFVNNVTATKNRTG